MQNALYQASFNYDLLIDIGCNVGVMTLGTLLHNPNIKSIAVDSNPKANQLLKQTLLLNKLTDRCYIISAVVGATNGVTKKNYYMLNGNGWLLHPEKKDEVCVQLLPEILAEVAKENYPEEQANKETLELNAWQKYLQVTTV